MHLCLRASTLAKQEDETLKVVIKDSKIEELSKWPHY
jgi:hypothetical protein